ncbi:MAG: hypothetical protein JOY98_04700 [Candidatus Eremiobacteraeota bacterium]|nr:hypothetical protein [Candidatus Eremiobacteraeota bacterium]MBV8283025.1 hypothetical protein [Candidatus Eremiobacteraeota bacterium]
MWLALFFVAVGLQEKSRAPGFFVEFPPEVRAHQVRLEGGDASSDSYCFA